MRTTPPTLSRRARATPSSPIRKLAPLAAGAKQRGVKVYHLNIGQPDIKSPPEFFEGLRKFSDEVVAYEPAKGNEQLCRAWSKSMNALVGIETKPEEFLITCGASEALLFAFMAVADQGDEIIVFDPTYANYIGFAVCAGITLTAVPSRIENGFALPPVNEILKAITPRTRAILVCNPNNPTGTVYTAAELKQLVSLCEEHNLFLISDEAYREFVYDGAKFQSVYQVAPRHQRVIVTDSLSKRYSLCGSRVGCLIATNEDLFQSCHRMAQARLAAPSAEQFAAAYMIERVPVSFMESVRNEYQKRRDTLYAAVSQIPGATLHKPAGAFYAIAGLPVASGEEFASFMLTSFAHNNETTFVAPAAGFYITPGKGTNEIRMAYVLRSEDIIRAVDCLAAGLKAFASK